MNSITLKPSISEKSYALSKKLNTYIFEVSPEANKQTIIEQIKKQYNVTAIDVNVANIKGKTKRTFLNKRGKFVIGTRSDRKKAYVKLKEGDKLPIFEAEEEAAEKAEKVAKKVEKKMKKGDK